MKILYEWVKEFVDVEAPAEEVARKLSSVGVVVDVVEDSGAGPRFEVDVTTNRPDCLGHYGVARETAAGYRVALKPIQPKLKESKEKAAGAVRVQIEAPELCSRFSARVVRGVKVGESPEWMKRRLEALGQGSISNVVDITNYVMFEMGKPIHGYDYDTIREHRIIVRRAKKGEKLKTLDGMERTLRPEVCVIADGERAVGIGGIMGGLETEIGPASTNVLIESAWFDPVATRKASRLLGLRTEASVRFERGADLMVTELATQRAAELIQELAGGEILAGAVEAFPPPAQHAKIELTRREILRVMGADVPDKEIEAILDALGFHPVRMGPQRGSQDSLTTSWECVAPSWRHDVTREIDLVEEVARHTGYDKFPSRLPPARQAAKRLPHAEAEGRIRERLVGMGYQEIMAIPIVNPERDGAFRGEGVEAMAVQNPLSEENSLMRTSGLVSMTEAIGWNLNRSQRNLRLFEIGKSYEWRNKKPYETRVLTLGATGMAREKSVHEAAREFSFADLKGELDMLGDLAGGFLWEHGGPGWTVAGSAATLGIARGGGASSKKNKSAAVGVAGQLSRRIAEGLKLRQDVYLAELSFDALVGAYEARREQVKFQALPKYPGVERDFSLVLAAGVTFGQVAEEIRAAGIAEVESVEAVDLFRGGQVPAGKHSLLVRVTFQSHEETLTEGQLNEFTGRIVKRLEEKLGATLRAG